MEERFVFVVNNEAGEAVYTLTEAEDELFEAQYPEPMTHQEEMEWAHRFPIPVYNHCLYYLNQVITILRAYSESEYERFLKAYEEGER